MRYYNKLMIVILRRQADGWQQENFRKLPPKTLVIPDEAEQLPPTVGW